MARRCRRPVPCISKSLIALNEIKRSCSDHTSIYVSLGLGHLGSCPWFSLYLGFTGFLTGKNHEARHHSPLYTLLYVADGKAECMYILYTTCIHVHVHYMYVIENEKNAGSSLAHYNHNRRVKLIFCTS
jgi:hypothetical protein